MSETTTTPTNPYATTRDAIKPGALLPHISTGGKWRVERVDADGAIYAVSDAGARRMLKPAQVDKCLAYAATFNQPWLPAAAQQRPAQSPST
jgi:hypothetical protein